MDVSIRNDAILCRKERLDEICCYASTLTPNHAVLFRWRDNSSDSNTKPTESLQPSVSRGGTRDEQILPSNWRGNCTGMKICLKQLPLLGTNNLNQWGPLAQGQLARPLDVRGTTLRSAGGGGDPSTTRAESIKIINRVEELAKQKGWTMVQIALAWTLKRVTSPIIGFSSVERMDEALSAIGKELTLYEERFLEELYTPLQIEGHF